MSNKMLVVFPFLFLIFINSCGSLFSNTARIEVWNNSEEKITVTVDSTNKQEINNQTNPDNEAFKNYVRTFDVGWYSSPTKDFKVKFKGNSIDETITVTNIENFETRYIYLVVTNKKTTNANGTVSYDKGVGILTR